MKSVRFSRVMSTLLSLLLGSSCFAAGPGAKFINYYEILLKYLGINEASLHDWIPVVGGIVSLAIITVLGLRYRKAVEGLSDDVSPDPVFGVRSLVEGLLGFVHGVAGSVIGEKKVLGFLPLLSSLFIFILISNLTGLIPGFIPATESINTNIAMALCVFFAYNYAGIKEHGGGYVKQFLGPVAFLAPLMLIIEMVGHLARPLSLSLRLYGNIFGDHLVLSVFTGLTYAVLPALLLFFGLLVASLQSFVFTLLSSIYISLAISHDH